jgi:hypothetical protein
MEKQKRTEILRSIPVQKLAESFKRIDLDDLKEPMLMCFNVGIFGESYAKAE